jgi:serine/threonine-protein kinase ATR
LRTHIKGVVTRHPDWEENFAGFQAESAWMVGDWTGVEDLAARAQASTPELTIARTLLAIRNNDTSNIELALRTAYQDLGAPITAAGKQSYRRSYDSVINLHRLHELGTICTTGRDLAVSQRGSRRRQSLEAVNRLRVVLSARLEATFPTFRSREPILSMRRTAFAIG